MNTDEYFKKGKGHAVCEDFACNGKIQEWHYAIISDGCSSSKNFLMIGEVI